MNVQVMIPGAPVPLERHRASRSQFTRVNWSRSYLPGLSAAHRHLVQACWLEAGRPSLGARPFTASLRFYGARANADLGNLIKAILDALNGLAFADDRQLVCLSGAHKLPVDDRGARTEVDLWPAVTA